MDIIITYGLGEIEEWEGEPEPAPPPRVPDLTPAELAAINRIAQLRNIEKNFYQNLEARRRELTSIAATGGPIPPGLSPLERHQYVQIAVAQAQTGLAQLAQQEGQVTSDLGNQIRAIKTRYNMHQAKFRIPLMRAME